MTLVFVLMAALESIKLKLDQIAIGKLE